MKARVAAVLLAGWACGACANEQTFQSITYSAPMQLGASTTPAPEEAMQKTMASKVLSAIALEKVTGRKPDPSRLIEAE